MISICSVESNQKDLHKQRSEYYTFDTLKKMFQKHFKIVVKTREQYEDTVK